MSHAKHTPGPWKVGIMESPRSNDTHARRDFAYYLDGNPERATVPNADANARLIEAAPAMLTVLKLARDEFARISYQKKADPRVLELIDKAISKATGGAE